MALPLAWSVGVVVGWGGALCFLLSPFSALALVAPASGGWLGASLSLVVVEGTFGGPTHKEYEVLLHEGQLGAKGGELG